MPSSFSKCLKKNDYLKSTEEQFHKKAKKRKSVEKQITEITEMVKHKFAKDGVIVEYKKEKTKFVTAHKKLQQVQITYLFLQKVIY